MNTAGFLRSSHKSDSLHGNSGGFVGGMWQLNYACETLPDSIVRAALMYASAGISCKLYALRWQPVASDNITDMRYPN